MTPCVLGHMVRRIAHLTLIAGVAGMMAASAAQAGDFAAYGADEDVCRHVGEAAIQNATGPEAAARYDAAHGRCMQDHWRRRWMQAYQNGPGPPPFPRGNVDNSQYPEAFFNIPYATPGYGYDGFSPY